MRTLCLLWLPGLAGLGCGGESGSAETDGRSPRTTGADVSTASTTRGHSPGSRGGASATSDATSGAEDLTGNVSGEEESSSTGADTYSGDETTGTEDEIPVVVAVGTRHARYASLDEGASWCQVGRADEPIDEDLTLLRNVSYAEGLFVAGSWSAVLVSENGVEWYDVTEDEDAATGQWIAQVQYGNGWWVATGGGGSAMRSADLMTWEVTSDGLSGTEPSRSLAFGNGVFVTGRNDVGWWQSDDGEAWTLTDPAGGTQVVFDGDGFVSHPGYDEGPRATRLRSADSNGIERAVGEGTYELVASFDDGVNRFAFGRASQQSIDRAILEVDVATCLGLM